MLRWLFRFSLRSLAHGGSDASPFSPPRRGRRGPHRRTEPRPMTFLDVQNMRQANGQDVSPDGRQMLYTLSTPDWQTARRQSDIYLVSTRPRLAEHSAAHVHERQERDDAEMVARRQLHRLPLRSRRDRRRSGRPVRRGGGRGGAGRRRRSQPTLRACVSTAAKRSASPTRATASRISSSPKTASRSSTRRAAPATKQIYTLTSPTSGRARSRTRRSSTRHATGIGNWQFSPDGGRSTSSRPTASIATIALRTDKQFTVKPRNPASSLASLWVFDLDSKQEKRLDERRDYSVAESDDLARRQVDRLTTACRRAGTSAAISSRTTTPICI